MSLANMQGKLSRAEMKNVLAGDDPVKDCLKKTAQCSSHSACCSGVCMNTDGESGKMRCQ